MLGVFCWRAVWQEGVSLWGVGGPAWSLWVIFLGKALVERLRATHVGSDAETMQKRCGSDAEARVRLTFLSDAPCLTMAARARCEGSPVEPKMSAAFRILCALADARSTKMTQEQADEVCAMILGSKTLPVPNRNSLSYVSDIVLSMQDAMKEISPRGSPVGQKGSATPDLPGTVQDAPTEPSSSSLYMGSPIRFYRRESASPTKVSCAANGSVVECPAAADGDLSALRLDESAMPSLDSIRTKVSSKERGAITKYVQRMVAGRVKKNKVTRSEAHLLATPLSLKRTEEIISNELLHESLLKSVTE